MRHFQSKSFFFKYGLFADLLGLRNTPEGVELELGAGLKTRQRRTDPR